MTFTKEQIDKMSDDAHDAHESCERCNVCCHVVALAAEVERLQTSVRQFLVAFSAWQDADGWDNLEWDEVIDAVEKLVPCLQTRRPIPSVADSASLVGAAAYRRADRRGTQAETRSNQPSGDR